MRQLPVTGQRNLVDCLSPEDSILLIKLLYLQQKVNADSYLAMHILDPVDISSV